MRDWRDGDDPGEWQDELDDWRDRQQSAREEQTRKRLLLDAAEARVAALTQWRDRLAAARQVTVARAAHLAALTADRLSAEAAAATLGDRVAEHRQARDVATARLLAAPALTLPVTLLPVRLETRWTGDMLSVRIYPDEIGVDAHDPRLTESEEDAGGAYWAMRADGSGEQAWANLVRRLGGPRAAWVARVTDPAAPGAPESRGSAFDVEVRARLLPDRFAVVAYANGDPINVAPAGAPERFVTWTGPVLDPLPVPVLDAAGEAGWLTVFEEAVAAGMAVKIVLPPGAPAIEQLVVVGLRAGDTDSAALADLLDAHAYTGGAEVLADGTPTNNTAAVRAAHDPGRAAAVAADLLRGPVEPAAGSAGHRLAELLGLPAKRLGAYTGAAADRASAAEAVRLLVGLGVRGPMTGAGGWELVEAEGPAPALRLGRQPYGVLPATSPGRWQPAPGEAGAAFARFLSVWGRLTGPPLDINPAGSAPIRLTPRRVTRTDTGQLDALLLENAEPFAWGNDTVTYAGADGLAGSLLTQIARAARPQAPEAVDAAAGTLAATDPEVVTRLLSQYLDAVCRRVDPWVEGVVTERLRAQRATPGCLVGAYGYLTDVQPRTEPSSHGYVHAPSLGHAATAAVLRSGYLGRHRPEELAIDLSSRRVRMARWVLSAVRGGQPLGAVLGYQFERDLADYRLQPFLGAFRKLTRFRTGTKLEGLEETRRSKQAALALALATLDRLRQAVATHDAPIATAAEAVAAATAGLDRARAAATPYTAMQTELAGLETQIPQLQARLDALDAARPAPATRQRTINVP